MRAFLVVTLEKKEAKRLNNRGFPPVFQKEFSDMHGVKQTQMKFIILKFAFVKKPLFARF